MSISLTKDGITSTGDKITFTDGSVSFNIYSNGVIETPNYYFVDNYKFDKNKVLLIYPIVVRSTSTSIAGTCTLNLTTGNTSSLSNIEIELGTSKATWKSALQKVLAIKNHSYSYKLMYSSVSYNSTVGTNEKTSFLNHSVLTASNYSLANKAPTIETPGSGSVTCTFNASSKIVSITANKKPNWALIGLYVSLV